MKRAAGSGSFSKGHQPYFITYLGKEVTPTAAARDEKDPSFIPSFPKSSHFTGE
jgi:hypothetical protein